MLKSLKDSSGLTYLNLLKLSMASLVLGLLVGLVDTIFGRVLLAIGDFRGHHFSYLIPFLGLVGLLIVYLYQTFGGESRKGMGLIFEVGHAESEDIPLRLIPLVIFTTWLTHLFGGSAGREGVAVQLGATISHYFSRFFTFENSSRIFLVTGMAAGFAGLFQTPIAAVFFAMEVLVLGQLNLVALLPATIAAFTASITTHTLGLEKFGHLIEVDISLTPLTFAKLAIIGLLFGLAGNLFAISLAYTKQKAAQLLSNGYRRILLGGLVLSLILFLLYQGRYSGLGTNLIDASFNSQTIYSYDWLLKLALTVLTLAIGFQGGEVTPLFSIGASLGIVLAPLFGLPPELAAAAGYISVFGSATNTLIAPIFIGGEVFGFANTPYFFIVMTFAFIVNSRASIYGGQKSLSL